MDYMDYMDDKDKLFLTGVLSTGIVLGSAIGIAGHTINPQEEGELCQWFKKGASKETVQVCVKKEDLIEAATKRANEKTGQHINAYIKPPNP